MDSYVLFGMLTACFPIMHTVPLAESSTGSQICFISSNYLAQSVWKPLINRKTGDTLVYFSKTPLFPARSKRRWFTVLFKSSRSRTFKRAAISPLSVKMWRSSTIMNHHFVRGRSAVETGYSYDSSFEQKSYYLPLRAWQTLKELSVEREDVMKTQHKPFRSHAFNK